MDNTHCLPFLRTEKSSPTGRRLLFLFIRHARARSLLCVRLHKPKKQVPGTKLSCISKDWASSLAMDGRDQARRWSALLSHVQHCCLRWTCSSLGLLCPPPSPGQSGCEEDTRLRLRPGVRSLLFVRRCRRVPLPGIAVKQHLYVSTRVKQWRTLKGLVRKQRVRRWRRSFWRPRKGLESWRQLALSSRPRSMCWKCKCSGSRA